MKLEPETINVRTFDYDSAFSRNLGWLTESDQKIISKLRVGIVGLGGVGGQYAEILTRLGVQNFIISDPDHFGIENTNRQNGCQISNYGKSKALVIRDRIKDINPMAQVRIIPEGLKPADVSDFCEGIDIYLDAIDFFEFDIRIALFRQMRALGKAALTVAPFGAGAACIVFTEKSMSFDDYFGLHTAKDHLEKCFYFLLGLAPSMMQRLYLVERSRVDFSKGKTSSLPMGVYMCASVAATTILKLALNRGQVQVAPHGIHFDPYLGKLKKSYVFWGYRNPLQKLKMLVFKKFLKKK